LEHLTQDSLISVLKEIHRVGKPDAEIYIVLPHFLSWNAADLDHYRAGSRKTFTQFCKGYPMNSPYPDLFEEESIDYDLLNSRLVGIVRMFWRDDGVAQIIPNAVNEIQYTFKNLQR